MKKASIVVVVALAVLIAGGLALWRWDGSALGPGWWSSTPPHDYTDDARGATSTDYEGSEPYQIQALGRLEPVRGILTIVGVVGDRIDELKVKEGDELTKGDLIAVLASRPLRQIEQRSLEIQIAETEARREAEATAADARIRIAEINLEKAKSSQSELDAQTKQVALAESNLELAKKDVQRLEGLSAALVSRQELERQRLLAKKAEAELAAAQAALDTARETSRFAEQAAQAELDAAQAAKQQVINSIPVGSLKKKLELAERQTAETLITAPMAGTVLRIFTREGEIITSQPILQMADLRRLVCIAEVYEGNLSRIRVGQPAIVTSEAFPPGRKRIRGRVTRIGGMVASPELRAIDPSAPLDRHVVEVIVEFEEGAIPPTAQLANLQVDVTIQASDEGNHENSAGVAQSRPQ